MIEKPILYIVVLCYNEEEVLPVTMPMFKEKVKELSKADLIDERSRILFVNDGSKDRTWDVLSELCQADPVFCAIKLSRNRGHQNALLAGLMEAKDLADITISIDCDGQDDINAMDEMVKAYLERTSSLQNENTFSRPVLRTIDYIDRHLHSTIRLNDIAEEADVTPNYLSALFAKEMKMTISRYIRKRRIEASESLLQYYDYSITEIAEYFDFSSVSHFIKVFKEETGMTPAVYKQTKFRRWKD